MRRCTPAVDQRLEELGRQVGRAPAVDHARRTSHAAARGLDSTACSSWPTLSSNRMKVSSSTSRCAWRMASNTRGKELLAVLQQPERGCRAIQRGASSGSISAASGAWSDRCDQGRRGSTIGACTARCARRCGRAAAAASAPEKSARARRWHARTPRAAGAALEHAVGAAAPVVEVAGHDQRRVGRHLVAHHAAQQLELPLAVRLAQAQVHAHRVHSAAAGRARAARSAAARASSGPATDTSWFL